MTDAKEKAARDRAEMDQMLAALSDVLPKACWGLYRNMMDAGFDKDQAFQLVRDWMGAVSRRPKE